MSWQWIMTRDWNFHVNLFLCHFLEWYARAQGEVNYRKPHGCTVKTDGLGAHPMCPRVLASWFELPTLKPNPTYLEVGEHLPGRLLIPVTLRDISSSHQIDANGFRFWVSVKRIVSDRPTDRWWIERTFQLVQPGWTHPNVLPKQLQILQKAKWFQCCYT